MVEFRVMQPEDLGFFLKLMGMVGWGMTPEDYYRILRFSPQGCFIASNNDVDLGMVATSNYGKVAWMGNLVVVPEARGFGLGGALMERGIEYLKDQGVEGIRLDSVANSIPLYRRLGFKEEYWSLRFTGQATIHKEPGVSRMRKKDLAQVFELDLSYFKAPRRKMLEYVFTKNPSLCYTAWNGEKLTGFIMAKLGTDNVKIGPWIVKPSHSEAAEELLHAVMNERPGEKLWVGVPEDNQDSVDILARNGFESLPSSLRMCHGDDSIRENTEGVYGLGGPDKG
ncbi:MAG: GNAT family N-acetyltransferase [Candidatus Bathyarchaeota archaeon]|nr:GNAT family N-acetyltransferase [Candidatus Bathyarchaeota archaeon]